MALRNIVVGREREVARLERGLQLVSVAVISGAPGVGKSTLVHAVAARRSGPVVVVQGGASIEDAVARELADGDTWAVVEARAALVIVDDADAYADPTSFVRAALATLVHGRLVVVCRDRLPLDADDPDRLELELDGLDRAAASELWDRLVALYGFSHDFATAWRESRGNPMQMRAIQLAGRGVEPVVVDAACHELRAAAVTRSLASRSSLRALLYAFARAPDHALDRDAITQALWSTPYAPLRHDSSLKSSIRRLRALLVHAGVKLDAIADGYRLVAPVPIVFVPASPASRHELRDDVPVRAADSKGPSVTHAVHMAMADHAQLSNAGAPHDHGPMDAYEARRIETLREGRESLAMQDRQLACMQLDVVARTDEPVQRVDVDKLDTTDRSHHDPGRLDPCGLDRGGLRPGFDTIELEHVTSPRTHVGIRWRPHLLGTRFRNRSHENRPMLSDGDA